VPDERQQLASIAAVTEKLERDLDGLFASVAELRATLGAAAPGIKAVPVTENLPGPDPAGQPAPGSATPLQAADRLSGAVEGMRDELRAVSDRLGSAEERQAASDKQQTATDKSVQRGRRLLIGLVISFALDITLTILVTIATFQAHSASSQAKATAAQLRANQITACGVGNQTRAEQIQLWSHLAAQSKPAPGSTPQQIRRERQTVAALLAYVRQTFRHLDCRSLYRLR
jgi:hypothetical protein